MKNKPKHPKALDTFKKWLASNCSKGEFLEVSAGPKAFMVVKVPEIYAGTMTYEIATKKK